MAQAVPASGRTHARSSVTATERCSSVTDRTSWLEQNQLARTLFLDHDAFYILQRPFAQHHPVAHIQKWPRLDEAPGRHGHLQDGHFPLVQRIWNLADP